MARSNPEVLRRPTRTPGDEAALRLCDRPGCDQAGVHRAPKDRNRLADYYFFCFDHAQAYNRAWDYCAGLDETEIEAMIRRSATWDRPTWPLGGDGRKAAARQAAWRRMSDPFDVLGGAASGATDGETAANTWGDAPPRDLPRGVAEGLATLDLDHRVTADEVKRRYKALVKRLHPDVNGGDRDGEEKFKTVNAAYRAVMIWLGAAPGRP
ncbi:MAG: J domain-containing protein [Alphaproteobacteria bacterium]